jgi:hypothetical protein
MLSRPLTADHSVTSFYPVSSNCLRQRLQSFALIHDPAMIYCFRTVSYRVSDLSRHCPLYQSVYFKNSFIFGPAISFVSMSAKFVCVFSFATFIVPAAMDSLTRWKFMAAYLFVCSPSLPLSSPQRWILLHDGSLWLRVSS